MKKYTNKKEHFIRKEGLYFKLEKGVLVYRQKNDEYFSIITLLENMEQERILEISKILEKRS